MFDFVLAHQFARMLEEETIATHSTPHHVNTVGICSTAGGGAEDCQADIAYQDYNLFPRQNAARGWSRG